MTGKTLVIARREFMAAVKTKGFIVGVILMPLLMAGGIIIQTLTRDIVDLSTKKCAVIDRSPDQQLSALLLRAADRRNKSIVDEKTGHQTKPKFELAVVEASDVDAARFRASEQIRGGELMAMVEIGPDVLSPKQKEPSTQPMALPDRSDPYAAIEALNDPDSLVYYTTNRPTYTELREFVQQTLQPRIVSARLNQSQVTIDAITQLAGSLVVPRGLAEKDPVTNVVTFEPRKNEIVIIIMPIVMVMLMFIVVLVGASPLTTNIIEEKQLRIAEVLLGSVSPFQLMMGKLLGGVATSLTLGVIYVSGAFVVARQLGVLHLLSPALLGWFVVFTIVASLMYGALFVVAGAAATNIKEAQALVTPMMLIVVLPMFLIGPILSDPHGLIAQAGTFFPLSAPMVMMMRLGIPPAPPWWHPIAAVILSGLMTIVLVWVAGRVFRAGFLLVGRPASIRELIGWILRG